MIKQIIMQSIKMLVVFTLLTGAVYPALIGAAAYVFFPRQATGSLVYINGKAAGSYLLGQNFTEKKYFEARPSFSGYMTLPSRATNYGPLSAILKKESEQRRKNLLMKYNLNGDFFNSGKANEMLFTSASGLDPHISPQAALMQSSSVARARNFDEVKCKELNKTIERMIEKPQFGIFGQPRINVLKLNMETDKL